MANLYKLLIKILFIIVAPILLACDREEDQPKLDTTLLFGKQWQLTKVTFNEKGQDIIDSVPVCQQDDAIEFKSDQTFIRHNGQNKCSQEADSETSNWRIFQEPKTMMFENIEYQIIELSQTSLNLQRELQGTDTKVVEKYYYSPIK